MEDFSIEITKRVLLDKWNNCMSSGEEYLIYGRILNAEKTRYRRFRFVVSFEYWEVEEYFEKDFFTKQDVKEYLEESIAGYTLAVRGYNDTKAFYEMCNDSIERYNDRIRKAA